jgi:hypothetical protein
MNEPVEDLYALIRHAWSDMMKAREQGDPAREERAERRMNSLLGRLSTRLRAGGSMANRAPSRKR